MAVFSYKIIDLKIVLKYAIMIKKIKGGVNMSNVRIQDDLYTYVNQEKIEQLTIPSDMPSIGGFATLSIDVEKLMINEFKEMCNQMIEEALKQASVTLEEVDALWRALKS